MAVNHPTVIFRQLFELSSSTYTYVLACKETKKAVLIDPVLETVNRDVKVAEQMGVDVLYALNTHCHADHVTGTGELKKRLPNVKSVISKASGAEADILVNDGEIISFGKVELEVRSTPGHTSGCVTYVCHAAGCAFTGDALLIGGCGRTDFQQGHPELLYERVHSQILSLPDDYILYVGHNYQGLTATTVGEEKKYNARLTKSKEEFVTIMKNLGLPYPKQIDKALPANLVDGVYEKMDDKVKVLVEPALKSLAA